MKQESVAWRAKKIGISTIMVLAMIVSGLAVFPTTPGVIGQDSVGGEYGGDFRIGIKEIPDTFNPLVEANEPSQQMIDLLYDSLGKVDPYSLILEPWIAKEWNVDPDNQSVVTVILRNEVKWHDSTSLSVNDVDYTFGPDGYNIAYLAGTILDPDNNTITFLLDGPNALFFSEMLLMKLIPQGFTSASTEENGCGPFFLNTTATVVDSSWTLQAFDEYFNGRPYVDSLVYKYYSEGFYNKDTGTGAGFDLLNGTLEFIGWDLTTNETFSTVIEILRPNNVTEVTLANPLDDYTFVNNEPGMYYKYIGMNNARDHILNDVNVRLAISYCLDKGSLAAYDISGGLIVADSIMSPKVKPWFNDSIPKYDVDQSIANSILDKAGYMPYNSTGFRQLPNGSHFSLDLLLPTQDEDISAPAMGDNLRTWFEAIGINVTIIPLTEEERMLRILNNSFDLYLSTETRGSINPNFLKLLFHSDNIATDDNLLNFEGRGREMYGMVSVNYSDSTNTTIVGQMNHTNVFDDGTSDILAYRNEELWGVTEEQLVWTSDGSFPTLPLKNDTVDDGYRIFRNRTVSEEFWSVDLLDAGTNPQLIDDVPVTQILDEPLVTVNTTYHKDRFVGAANATDVTNEAVTINAGPDDLGNSSVETGTIELWKEGEVVETTNFLGTGVQNVLLVDDDSYAENLIAYYQGPIENNSATVTVWDVAGSGDPTALDMAPYNVVIWVPDRGWMWDGCRFGPADETAVATYLDGGGNFMFSNIYYAENVNTVIGGMDADFDTGDFAYDYLALDVVNPYSFNEASVVEVDIPFNGWGGPHALDWSYWLAMGYGGGDSDDLTPTPSGTTCINNNGPAPAGIQYDSGTFKTVFMGFPFDTLGVAERDDAMARMLDWFVPPSAGCVAQLENGTFGNQTIDNIKLYNQTSGAYLNLGSDYYFNYSSGALNSSNSLIAHTYDAFYNYTTDMVEGTDYTTLNTWHYQNGKVNLTIPIDPVADIVWANYTWFNVSNGGNLFIDSNMTDIIGDIINNYTFTLNEAFWPEAGNYNLDNHTGIVTFNSPLAPGDYVNVTYTCFDMKFYNKAFTWPLDHGSGIDGMNIATADFHLKKDGGDISAANYNVDTTGNISLDGDFLYYGEALTADYWYYDPADMPGSLTFDLAHGALPKDGMMITHNSSTSHSFVEVYNAITGTSTPYSIDTSSADLTLGTFELPAVNPGDVINAYYNYYNDSEIVYTYDLANPNLSEGTLDVFKSGTVVPRNYYTIDLVTGHIELDDSLITLGPHNNLTATYCYFKDLGGSDYSLDKSTGMLTLSADVVTGDRILADYTYATYIVTDNKTGKIQIITNFDMNNDTLTMSFDYKKLDELVELANMQMDYESQAKYFKEVQGFLAEEVPCVPLFFFKVANAYNNSRYEGWDSTVGGIINFHSYIHLRNKINGDMLVSVSARFDYVTMGNDMDLEIRVEDLDGNTIPEVIFEFDGSGDFGESTFEWQDTDGDGAFDPDETGAYVVTYTAPTTNVSRSITITANAIRSSYVKGSGEFQVTVHPEINEFDIEIKRGTNETVTSIESGSETDIRITVTDSDTGDAIPDALVSLSISPLGLGGYLDDVEGTTDSNGEFTTVFGAVNVTVDTTFQISVTVSKDGYYDGTLDTSISVDKDPNIKGPSSGFLGLPAPSFLIIIMLLAGMSVFYARRRRRR